jgi:hypothetical protein
VDTNAIRARIQAQGWTIRELPIKRHSPNLEERIVMQWKLIAFRGEKSLEVGGKTIDEAMKNIGMALGVIPKG